jgi:phosphoribosylamine--glycine ligase
MRKNRSSSKPTVWRRAKAWSSPQIAPKPIAAINELQNFVGKNAAAKIVLEECLFGREVSLLMFADGENFALMPPVRDHKRIYENDEGANTGGMGTITDAESFKPKNKPPKIIEEIVKPTLAAAAPKAFRFAEFYFSV